MCVFSLCSYKLASLNRWINYIDLLCVAWVRLSPSSQSGLAVVSCQWSNKLHLEVGLYLVENRKLDPDAASTVGCWCWQGKLRPCAPVLDLVAAANLDLREAEPDVGHIGFLFVDGGHFVFYQCCVVLIALAPECFPYCYQVKVYWA